MRRYLEKRYGVEHMAKIEALSKLPKTLSNFDLEEIAGHYLDLFNQIKKQRGI